MAQHNETGKEGERLAREYLQRNGYKVLETNWRFKRDEIDIIARDGNVLVFVEVKSTTSDAWGEPAGKVTVKKQKNITRAADAYVKSNELDMEVRFDVISLLIDKTDKNIHHIQDAFYPLVN